MCYIYIYYMEFRINDMYLRFSSGFSATFLHQMYNNSGTAVSLHYVKQRRGSIGKAPRVLNLDYKELSCQLQVSASSHLVKAH